MRRATVGSVLVLVVSSFAFDASASEPRTHDGWYVRMGLGASLMHVASRNEWPAGVAEYSGVAPGLALEFALGGTPLPGLVLGGALWGEQGTLDAEIQYEDYTRGKSSRRERFEPAIGGLGPFVDWYPWPQRGLHFQAAIASGGVVVNDAHCNIDQGGNICTLSPRTRSGLMFGLGTGFEIWTGREWGLGGLLRVSHIYASNEDDSGHYEIWAPSLLVTATHH
ncbi:MAG: hypothetical protein AB7K71_25445 [Polyangiaceae bacterium]